jgi:mono/diheme cytochrome c family protein
MPQEFWEAEEEAVTVGDRQPGGLGDWGVLGFGILVGCAVIALLVAAYAIGANKGRADAEREADAARTAPAATEQAPVTPAADAEALAAFEAACGSCHALAVAGTSATIGPDLDELRPTEEQVLAAIANGGAGSGQMPAGLLSGSDAQRVAELVSSVAGAG